MNISDYIEQNKKEGQSTEEARKSLLGKSTMLFIDKESGVPKSVFSDVECEVAAPNPLQANADGHFPSSHFAEGTKGSYKIIVQNNRAETILKGSLSEPAKVVTEETE